MHWGSYDDCSQELGPCVKKALFFNKIQRTTVTEIMHLLTEGKSVIDIVLLTRHKCLPTQMH